MGWSCTAAAGRVMDAFHEAIAEEGRPSNQWAHGKNTYFAEVGKEHADGHISMQIWRNLESGYARKSGSIYIEPDGRIRRMPAHIKAKVDYLLGNSNLALTGG